MDGSKSDVTVGKLLDSDINFIRELVLNNTDGKGAIVSNLIYTYIGGLIIEKEFDRINYIIDKLLDYKLNSISYLSILTLTKPYSETMSNRWIFMNDAIKVFKNSMTSDQIRSTIKRLK